MVPDVSGIDRVFDYEVPGALVEGVTPGVRVVVPLHGRSVRGWVVASGTRTEMDRDHRVPDVLAPVSKVSGPGVVPELVSLTREVATRWQGPWRAVLTSASAPRLRPRRAVQSRGSRASGAGTPTRLDQLLDRGGGVIVVPPCASALHVVVSAASRGPVIVVCPTHRMARLGAAWLRRHGFTTAEIPEEWERAEAGVDVVIGARSAVWAPCLNLSALVVIDEHDDALKEERVPAWDAAEVARMRAQLQHAPLLLTSAIPSAQAIVWAGDRVLAAESDESWPQIFVEDLSSGSVPSSLLGSMLLSEISNPDRSVACILNTVGGARLLICEGCRVVQRCRACESALAMDEEDFLHCDRCGTRIGSVCVSCGNENLSALRGGHALLGREIQRSSGRVVSLVSSGTEDIGETANVLVGTDAILNRASGLDVVVLCDADRDLLAPRVAAPREFLAVVVRAARAVGATGKIVIQSRYPGHPVLQALASPRPGAAVAVWLESDIAQRRLMGFPPFTEIASVTYPKGIDAPAVHSLPDGVEVMFTDRGFVLRSPSRSALQTAVQAVRDMPGPRPRIVVDPRRY